MHQQARVPPRRSSPARTNNPREPAIPPSASSSTSSTSTAAAAAAAAAATPAAAGGPTRQRAGSVLSSRQLPLSSPTTENAPSFGPPAESVKKLDQIVQNFYNKAAVLVINSRMKVRPTRGANGQPKLNKWYQIDTDEIDDFREELKIWKTCGSMDNQPPPMIIDVYLDTSRLKDNQSLVVLDDEGKRWDVIEQLNSAASPSGSASSGRSTEVILERWRVELIPTRASLTDDFGPILPTIYKKAIVFFRSLFITTRLLPGWKFASQGPAKNSHPALTPRVRLRTSEPGRGSADMLRQPIDGRSDPVTEYVFGDLDVPVGRLSTSVTYRNDCSFRIDDSEALLSSRFMGVDENFFKPSLPQRSDSQREPMVEVGSLRDNRRRPNPSEVNQTYGSLSTFHGEGPLGTSPLSALRAVKPPGSDTSSPPASLPRNVGGEIPSSLPTVRSTATRPPMRVGDGSGRRPSVSFQPFKAGSLSGSPIPRQVDAESPASPQSWTRPATLPPLQQPRSRTSLTAGMPASLRGVPQPVPIEPSSAGSPRPVSTTGRYSSSFTHRRGRLSFGGASRAGDDEQGSSGRQSLASSVAQPGSGLLAEAEAASSGSLPGDDNTITDFLKALDSKKTLKSFETGRPGESAANRTVAQLSKFHMMKESNNALTESMTSSMQMHRSSSSSSRQIGSVPAMMAPASMSTSSSPGKPVSPHTPHTPAIPSRLSENSIADNSGGQRVRSRQGRTATSPVPEASRESTIRQEGATAIDIPLSPRLRSYQQRSSSVAQQSRAPGEDEDAELGYTAHRSVSLGAEDREPPTMSILLGRQMQMEEESTSRDMASGLQPAAEIQASGSNPTHQGSSESNPPEGLISGLPSSSSPFGRRRYTGMASMASTTGSRRQTPPHSSRGSFTGSISRLARGDDESVGEEPLVFDLSEMDALGRRSIEEGRGGHAGERGGYDTRGSGRRGGERW